MNEMVFEGMDALHNHLMTRGGANAASHGMIGNFYAAISNYKNPNTCSCKKGARAFEAIKSMYTRIPTSLSAQNAAAVRALFDNLPVVLKLDGAEVGRF
jgi:hypothetical protein